MDWFTWLLVNAERGGNDWVTATERKHQEGEGGAVSDDTWNDAPFHTGRGGYRLFLFWLLPKKVAAHFPQNTHMLYHIRLQGKFILLTFMAQKRKREGRNKEKTRG